LIGGSAWRPYRDAGQSGGVVLRREADAFVADNFEVDGDHYLAVVTDGKGVIANGTRISVPNNNMKSVIA
jgi:hypothetical protein